MISDREHEAAYNDTTNAVATAVLRLTDGKQPEGINDSTYACYVLLGAAVKIAIAGGVTEVAPLLKAAADLWDRASSTAVNTGGGTA